MTGPSHQERADKVVAALLARSNRLGSDRKNTNYAGGNASAKGTETDITDDSVSSKMLKLGRICTRIGSQMN